MFFDDYRRLVLFSPEKLHKINLFESARMFADLYCMLPGQEQRVHTHEAEDKIYVVLEGEVTATVGEERRTIGAGQSCAAPAGMPHGVRNDSGENAVLLVCMAPHPNPPRSGE